MFASNRLDFTSFELNAAIDRSKHYFDSSRRFILKRASIDSRLLQAQLTAIDCFDQDFLLGRDRLLRAFLSPRARYGWWIQPGAAASRPDLLVWVLSF